MPYIRIWIHFIWSTKNREKIISSDLKPLLVEHIKKNAVSKNIFVDYINCIEDHIHMTVSLGSDQSPSKVMQLIKGESSCWVNKNKFINGHFEWQDEYIAVSVSESVINKVREYIKRQEEHHRLKSFSEEYNEFVKIFGFKQ